MPVQEKSPRFSRETAHGFALCTVQTVHYGPMSRPSSKERLLDAAEAVVLRDGAARLTLDAVAAGGHVSKGGLLYHFPTKEALLEAMIARHVDRQRHRLRQALKTTPRSLAEDLKAEVLAGVTRSETDLQVSAALLAVVANDPGLLAPAAEYQRERFAQLAAGVTDDEFARRALVLLAVDGLFFLDLLKLAPFTKAQREALKTACLELGDQISTALPRNEH